MMFVEGRCVGGSTVVNGGMSWRTPERVLDHWSTALGLTELDARAMEPYFDEAEEILHVEYNNEDTFGRNDRSVVTGCAPARLGKMKDKTRATHASRCVGLNNCAYGCPTGRRSSRWLVTRSRATLDGTARASSTHATRAAIFVQTARGVPVGVREAFRRRVRREYGSFEVRAHIRRPGVRRAPQAPGCSKRMSRAHARY
jgi:choline dehydrogenase-like flavoprotein